MSKSLYLSVTIALPDDEFAAADITLKAGAPWRQLLTCLHDATIKHVALCEITEVRTKPTPGAKRGRKPRASPPPDDSPYLPASGVFAGTETLDMLRKTTSA